MRVRKLLRRRMVTTGFADRGLFGAETESARKGLPGRSISVVECDCSGADATPSPSRRGLKLTPMRARSRNPMSDATPSPSRRGLKPDNPAPLLSARPQMQHQYKPAPSAFHKPSRRAGAYSNNAPTLNANAGQIGRM